MPIEYSLVQRGLSGDLGSFRVTLQSEGTDTAEEFTAARVRKLKVNFAPGAYFGQLLAGAMLQRVEAGPSAPRKAPRKASGTA